MRTIKVLLADRERMARSLLELMLKSLPGYALCACTAEPAQLPGLCTDHQADLILVDPGFDIRLLGTLREECPWVKLIVLTDCPAWDYPELVRSAGTNALIYKQTPFQLSVLLERTLAGQLTFPEETPPVQIGLAKGTDFTPREKDVLRYLPGGHSNRTIAQFLGISEHAVHYHVNNLLSKTGFDNRIRLAVMVQQSGFVIPAEEYQNLK